MTPVNQVPSFIEGTNQDLPEDAGVQTVGNWATAISAGPANESSQAVNFIVNNNNNSLFTTQPAISSDGSLTYTPAANANGSATVTVQLHDDGGTAGGGIDTSASQTFTIAIAPVNDAPSFTKRDRSRSARRRGRSVRAELGHRHVGRVRRTRAGSRSILLSATITTVCFQHSRRSRPMAH